MALNAAVPAVPCAAPPATQQAALLATVLPTLHTALLEQQAAVGGMQRQLAAVPDVQPYLGSLDELAVTFAALPQPPSQLASQAQAAVDDIMRTVQQVRGGHAG